MKRIEFKNSSAQKRYDGFMKRLERLSSVLPKEDQKDVMMEYNSHIFESLQNSNDITEEEKLSKILNGLGEPDVFIKPIIADYKLGQATKSFNPVHILKALILNMASSVSYIIFFILYISLFAFVWTIVQKILHPDEVGLFVGENSFVFGVNSSENAHEVLGGWYIPVVLVVMGVLYVLITLLLRLKRKWNKKK